MTQNNLDLHQWPENFVMNKRKKLNPFHNCPKKTEYYVNGKRLKNIKTHLQYRKGLKFFWPAPITLKYDDEQKNKIVLHFVTTQKWLNIT